MDNTEDLTRVAVNLRTATTGISLRDLERDSGVPYTTLHRHLTSDIPDFRLSQLGKVCDALHIDMAGLFERPSR